MHACYSTWRIGRSDLELTFMHGGAAKAGMVSVVKYRGREGWVAGPAARAGSHRVGCIDEWGRQGSSDWEGDSDRQGQAGLAVEAAEALEALEWAARNLVGPGAGQASLPRQARLL